MTSQVFESTHHFGHSTSVSIPGPSKHALPHCLYWDIPVASRTLRDQYKSILWSSVICTPSCVCPSTVCCVYLLLSTMLHLWLGFIKLSTMSLPFLSIFYNKSQNLFSVFVLVNLRTVRSFNKVYKVQVFSLQVRLLHFFLTNFSSVSFPCLSQAKIFPSEGSGASEFIWLSYIPYPHSIPTFLIPELKISLSPSKWVLLGYPLLVAASWLCPICISHGCPNEHHNLWWLSIWIVLNLLLLEHKFFSLLSF